jgi:hypothetical protein
LPPHLGDHGRRRDSAALMEKPSQGNILDGVRPPLAAVRDAVSHQSSKVTDYALTAGAQANVPSELLGIATGLARSYRPAPPGPFPALTGRSRSSDVAYRPIPCPFLDAVRRLRSQSWSTSFNRHLGRATATSPASLPRLIQRSRPRRDDPVAAAKDRRIRVCPYDRDSPTVLRDARR